ncbi:MAG: peptide chain release factor N(5)-glutamine methyltransferase [Lachnospiraceae bacterium]|nr:peptide chain release factor N(5)-glutamine methyltransferase [Lachnospiraceae bacterium]
MKSYKEALHNAAEVLAQADIEEAVNDSWLLLQYVTGITRSEYFLRPDTTLSEVQQQKFFALVEKRAEHIPLQHITGMQEFMGMNFLVNKHVLIPRQDTEILVETALELWKKQSVGVDSEQNAVGQNEILDMCTGSGCIAISLAALAKNARVSAVDISPEALCVAKKNAENLCHGKVTFYQGDLFAALNEKCKFQMIVSNPPYIPSADIETLMPEVREYEPRLALDGTEDGLYFYRKLAAQAGNYLAADGWILFEIGCEQADDVRMLLEENGFCDIFVRKDYAGLDRVVGGRKVS